MSLQLKMPQRECLYGHYGKRKGQTPDTTNERIFFGSIRPAFFQNGHPHAQYKKQRRNKQSVAGIGENLEAKFVCRIQKGNFLCQAEITVSKESNDIKDGGYGSHHPQTQPAAHQENQEHSYDTGGEIP